MMVLPAVDILDGKAVQLVGGRPGTEKVSLPDPREVALDWEGKGAPAIHLVDLNAAMGRGDNFGAITSIMSKVKVPLQVGGGIRTTEAVQTLLALGASRVVVGTRAITDPEWFRIPKWNKVVLAGHKGREDQLKVGRSPGAGFMSAPSTEACTGECHTNVNVEARPKDRYRGDEVFREMCLTT